MKKHPFCLIVYLLLVNTTTIVFAQKSDDPPSPVPQEIITPPIPEAGALGKFGTFPVGLFTGTPNVTIDLYHLKTKRLEVPITLQYSSNGIKVDDISSKAGMGWVLNAGGVISRTIYGKPDDTYPRAPSPPSTNFASSSPDPNLVAWVYNYDANNYDTQFDEYSFNFNGYTGKFLIDLNNNPILIPYSNLKVEYQPTGASWIFRITTPDGIQYYFGGNGASESMQTASGSCSRNATNGAKNDWYLTKMIDANNPSDSINFIYAQSGYTYTSHINQTITYFDPSSPCGQPSSQTACGIACGHTACIYGGPGSSGLGINNFCITQNIVSSVNLIAITSSSWGSVGFSYINKPDIGTNALVSSIQIFQNNNNSNLLQTINFNYATVVPNSGRINIYADQIILPITSRAFLTTVNENDNKNNIVRTYSFQYNDMFNLPPRLSFQQDYYGYYNGQASNYNSFIPTEATSSYPTLSPTPIGANRSINYTYAAKGLLSTVTFPTGGTVQFVYEGNAPTQSPTSLATSGAGLRVKQQIVYDPVAQSSTTTNYTYSGMIIPYSPRYINNISYQNTPYSIDDDNEGQSCRAEYAVLPVSCRYIQLSSNTAINLFGEAGNPVYYKEVSESLGDNYIVGGTDHYFTYLISQDFYNSLGAVSNNLSVPVFPWRNGFENMTQVFKMSGANKIVLKETDNTYSIDPRINLIDTNYVLNKHGSIVAGAVGASVVPVTGQTALSGYYALSPVFLVGYLSQYDIQTYYIQQLWQYLSSKKQIDYDLNGANPITTITNYSYDNPNHTLLTRKTIQDSKNNTHVSLLKYPQDYANSNNIYTGNPALDVLISKNIIDPVIEQQDSLYLNGSLSGSIDAAQLNTFKILPNSNSVIDKQFNLMIPNTVTDFQPYSLNGNSQNMDNRYAQVMSLDSYDNFGNITQFTSKDGIHTSILWDYKNSYPISKTLSATISDIAYTSFEADGAGNWTFAGAGSADPTAPTGSMSYSLSNGSISKSGLTNGNTYIISYWSTSGAYNVSGSTSVKQGKTINNWTYFEHTVRGTTSVMISGNGNIDELRLYPSTAQMTTFTYAPLIGMTSQCDADNRITYFFYDGLQRLSFIKDQDGNVIKTMQYHYQNQ